MLMPVPNRLTAALLYVRVSGAEHQKEGLSLDFQEKATRGYVAKQPGWIIGGEYRDIESGAHDDRADYQRLLAEARRLHKVGQRTAVVVLRLDRFGRDLAEQSRARKELRKLGCVQHSIKDGGKLRNTHAGMLMVISQDERERISARVADIRGSLVAQGWNYGRPAFGYRLRPATRDEIKDGVARKLANTGVIQVFEPDPITSGVAAEAFGRVAAGETVRTVARWLASLPAELRGDKNWPHQSVTLMLRSATYVARPTRCGTCAGCEPDDDNDARLPCETPVLERSVARWPAIVSDDVWAAVQTRLAAHAVHPHESDSSRYLLTGFLRCGRCGCRMVATGSAKDGRPRGYRCTGAMKGSNAPVPGCNGWVTQANADRATLDVLCGVLDGIADPARRPGVQRALDDLNQPNTADAERMAELEREIAKSQKRLADAAVMLVDGTLDRDGYAALRDQQTKAHAAASAELKRVRPVQPTIGRMPSAQSLFADAGSWSAMLRSVDVPAQRAVLEKFIDNVVVTRRGYRQYDAAITWTPLGERLTNVATQAA